MGGGELWSLRDVSLDVAAGESVGLIGHNGAGKSTTLKLVAGITRPTRGTVRSRGRIASLINLGAGFHRELTGRENVQLNAVILGLSRREAADRFDEIVDFAELGPSIDMPIKQYSSGMYARLGFAVAAHVDPDVLLVDEVLSVGDVAFQDKSFRKMLSFRDRGCSILFVSHNLSAVETMCHRAVWLDHGEIRRQGPTADVVRAYLDAVDQELVAEGDAGALADGGEESVVLQEATVRDAEGTPCTDFAYGVPLLVRLRCLARAEADEVSCTVTVRGDYAPLFSATTPERMSWRRGPHVVDCRFASLPLLPGLYRVEAQVSYAGSAASALPHPVAAFRVTTDLAAFGSASPVAATKSRGGFLAVPYSWRLESAAGVQDLAGLHLPAGG